MCGSQDASNIAPLEDTVGKSVDPGSVASLLASKARSQDGLLAPGRFRTADGPQLDPLQVAQARSEPTQTGSTDSLGVSGGLLHPSYLQDLGWSIYIWYSQ